MSLLVVDTDVVSYIFKDHPTGEAYREILKDQELVPSFMTLAELRLGGWAPGKQHRSQSRSSGKQMAKRLRYCPNSSNLRGPLGG